MIKILKASAGTGKTYRLSLEYLVAILRGEKYEEIVVMTFTRKATAEIRERIIEHIEDLLANKKESEVWQALNRLYPQLELDLFKLQTSYHQMLKQKEKINIFTIDSFINKIFKQAIAPYLGIYTYEIIETDKNREILEEVFKKILDKASDFALMEKFLTENTERDIENYLDLIKLLLANRWKFLLINYQKREKREEGDLVLSFNHCLEILKTIAEEKGKEFSDKFYKKTFVNLLTEYCQLEERKFKKELLVKYYQDFFSFNFWNGSKIRGKKVIELKAELEAKYEQFRQLLANYIYNHKMLPYETEVFKFSNLLFNIYDQIKFKEKVFTHTDISNYTYKYFKHAPLELTNKELLSDYFFELLGTKVSSLFIDEFQDTSILQWKILKPLINSLENVITVGDEKQSIYGWRGGEKDLFVKLENILSAKTESLRTCYRSQKEIINFINSFFLNLDIEWSYEKVDYLKTKTGGYLEVLLGGENLKISTNTKSFQKLNTEKQKEIIKLNDHITTNLKEEIAKTIAKSFTDYSQIGIIARSNQDLTEIANELDKLNIPYLLESKDSILEHKAIKPLFFLLKYLHNQDYFYLLNFLRSDLIGINNQLLKYLLKNKKDIENFMEEENVELQFKDLEQILNEIKKIKEIPFFQLSNYVMEKTGIMELFVGNSAALKNIYCFFEKMRQFNFLADFLNYLEENRESDELKQASVKGDNTLKLMTIHKAKGLSLATEFFYWQPKNSSGNQSQIEFFIKFDASFREVNEYLITTSKYKKIFEYLDLNFKKEEEKKELMEEINNVYVALTRPINNLFFYIEGPRQLKLNPSAYCWQNSKYEFYEEAVLKALGLESLKELINRQIKGELMLSSEEKKEDSLAVIPNFNSYFLKEKISKSKKEEIDSKLSLTRIEGLAIHYYLEYIKYNTKQEKDFAYSMLLVRYGNILGPKKLKEILKRTEKFIEKNSIYFSNKYQVFTEYEIRKKDKVYRIDRLLYNEKEKKVIILDYKSGLSREESQLTIYKKLVKEKLEEAYQVEALFLDII